MAVLRASMLWAYTIAPGLTHAEGTEGPPLGPAFEPTPQAGGTLDTPEPAGSATVYVVPAGKRAIVRHVSATLYGQPAVGSEPTFSLTLWAPGGSQQYKVHNFWWVRHEPNLSVWLTEDQWPTMLVMDPGWYLTGNNLASVPCMVTGSGMLLNLPA